MYLFCRKQANSKGRFGFRHYSSCKHKAFEVVSTNISCKIIHLFQILVDMKSICSRSATRFYSNWVFLKTWQVAAQWKIFQRKNSACFWLGTKTEYLSLIKEAVKFLLPFVTTYMWKLGFQNCYRQKMNIETDSELKMNWRVNLSSFKPNINKLIINKQWPPSH